MAELLDDVDWQGKVYSNGWTASRGGVLESTEPATGDVLATVGLADAYAPFGGTGASGNGSRFGSQSSWDEFTQWQWVTARPQAHGFPF
jgi:hypothetical protein